MSFWTDASLSPARQHRFRVVFTPINSTDQAEQATNKMYWWWAKSCTLPSFEVAQLDYQLVNFKFKYPALLAWNDVTVTLVEIGDKAKQILGILKASGYACPGDDCGSGIEKAGFSKQGNMSIEQLKADGSPMQTWELKNWFVKGARFGELSYESDEFVTIEMTLGYDCAILT